MPETDITINTCRDCGSVEGPFLLQQQGHGVCEDCASRCDVCDLAAETALVRGENLCESCEESSFWCDGCGERGRDEDSYYVSGDSLCRECQNDQACSDCGESYRDEFCGAYCASCHEYNSDSSGDGDREEFDWTPDVEQDADLGFKARAFASRRVRRPMTVGVELEFGGDDDYGMLRHLRRWGVTDSSEPARYSQPVEGWPEVKGDGSLSSGGELVTPKMTFSGEESAFWRIFAAFRSAIQSGDHNMNSECGLHIHVGMQKMDIRSAMSATTAYNHLEDILYHLAGACYSGGHRSNGGNDYAARTPKMFENPDRFRSAVGSDRYYGLNVSNYLNSRARCRCSAGFERGDLCTCVDIYKNTLEFRLFNTTANPIKMHAYAALCMAIVAYGEGKELTPNDLPAMDAQYGYDPSYTAQEYADRIVWMFQNLPMTEEERNSIRYCIRKSGLGPVLERAAARGQLETDLVKGILHDDSLIEVPEFRYRRPARRPRPPRVRQPAQTFVVRSEPRLNQAESCNDSGCGQCWIQVRARRLHRNAAGMWVDSNNHFVSMTEDEFAYYNAESEQVARVRSDYDAYDMQEAYAWENSAPPLTRADTAVAVFDF